VSAETVVLSDVIVAIMVAVVSELPATLAKGLVVEITIAWPSSEALALDALVTVTEVVVAVVAAAHVAEIDVVVMVYEGAADAVTELVVCVIVELGLVVVELGLHWHGQNCIATATLQSATWHHASSAQAVELVA